MITKEKHAHRVLFFRDHGRRRRASDGAACATDHSCLPPVPPVTPVVFVAIVTTFGFELPVTSGHFVYKVVLGIDVGERLVHCVAVESGRWLEADRRDAT
jgi:hypothetical protein